MNDERSGSEGLELKCIFVWGHWGHRFGFLASEI
jgi:hypothetical protein